MQDKKLQQENKLKKDMVNLFDRVVFILEQARGNVVRAVNCNMVIAYWLIGREIIHELQDGEERAEYGKQIIKGLSKQLTEFYGKGFSVQTLWNYRSFYLVYSQRIEIISQPGREFSGQPKVSLLGRECNVINFKNTELHSSFSPYLTWSHYRALMRVKNVEAREFYEQEAIECGWNKTQLERQIYSFYYDRIIANHGKQGLLSEGRERLAGENLSPDQVLKSPMVLEFL